VAFDLFVALWQEDDFLAKSLAMTGQALLFHLWATGRILNALKHPQSWTRLGGVSKKPPIPEA
jgi:hypothetical protein